MSNLSLKATKAASRFLEHRGYEVLETGWKCPAGTSDIVAEDGDVLVFVDVSARSSIDRGFPTDSCSRETRAHREMVALAYLAEHSDVTERPIRFDNVALLVVEPDRAMVRHHINALGEAVAQPQPETAMPTGADLQALPEAA
ncbi:YraN family protein [uncultured Adlercreutzia sp.]|uniref:YraN family protein n=1 Tax=uncultured Adlercreutzia sp. TaxID=875803 RepID=UPI0026F38A7F|nr:YraN family protein [uncultured Adlercreutzia sp.]